jgi:hypothetical protein
LLPNFCGGPYYGVKGAVALDGLDEQGLDWMLEKVATHHQVGF